MKLDLSDVTICAVDSITPQLAAIALKKSLDVCHFSKALLLTDVDVRDDAFETIKIPRINSIVEYSKFMLKNLVDYIETPYVLIVQWDGYITDASAWQPEFKNYDLIGARWEWEPEGKRVGNGGFSLRSKRLLTILKLSQFPFINKSLAEDQHIGIVYRKQLEDEFNIKFAPEDLADAFSHEMIDPQTKTFGFHALRNMWRYLSDDEMLTLLDKLHPSNIETRDFYYLIAKYAELQKLVILKKLYGFIKSTNNKEEILAKMRFYYSDAQFTTLCFNLCEKINLMSDMDLLAHQ
ncbi:MAG: DUF5672 family protein [Betaproteobacteria bacterium]